MPRVRKGEPEKDFVNRAVPVILKEKDVKDRKHAVAKAHGIWQQSKKKKKKKR